MLAQGQGMAPVHNAALQLLAMEMAGLAVVVLGLFWLRRFVGLTPLYVSLGVFQPVQVILAASVYVEVWPGVSSSPGTLMFAASLLAVLLVYIREDAIEARKVIYGTLGANVTMTLVMWVASMQLRTPGTRNFLELAPELFSQGARVTAVGTSVYLVDVMLLIALYGGALRRVAPLARVWLTLTLVLAFDALAFTTGVFVQRPDYVALLLAGLASKVLVAACFSVALVLYLRYVEPGVSAGAAPNRPLRDFFYALTYRDKLELQARRTSEVEAQLDRAERERRQVFERITDAFVALDRDWVYTFVNSKAAQVFGRTPEQLVGRHIWTEFPEARDQPFARAYERAMAEQEPLHIEEYYPPYDRWFENRIYPSPEGLTIYFHDITDRIRQRQALEQRAHQDELTGLPNRQAMRASLDALLGGAAPQPVGAVVLNLDRLHHVNDTLGYPAGDQVLVEAGRRLRALGRHGVKPGRVGGDEFVLACRAAASLDAVRETAHEAMHALSRPYSVDGNAVYMTCSAGVAWTADGKLDAAQLIGQADLAMNSAKQRGRNQLAAYSDEHAATLADRVALAAQMRGAEQRGEFCLHFQPVVEAASGSIVAAEALLRWRNPLLGDVPPGRFIPAAEDTGLIVPLGAWAFRSALRTLAGWQAAGTPVVPVSVNVSAVQFQRVEFADEIEAGLRDAGVAPGLLKLEVTESVLLEDAQAAGMVLARLKTLGIRVSLDDFGTGYSSLSQLRRLPIDEIKIDQSFVRDAGHDRYAATLCRAIVAMSRQLDVGVVAEGVETEAQASLLVETGCPHLQGFLFSRPVPADDFARLLARGVRWRLDGTHD